MLKQEDLQDKPPPLHSPLLGKMPEEPTAAAAICPSQPSGPLASRRLLQQSPSEPALGWKQGRAGYSLGKAGSTGEEHWDCAAARHPHVRQAQLTRARATQLRHREARAQPTASFLKIQLRTQLALHRES